MQALQQWRQRHPDLFHSALVHLVLAGVCAKAGYQHSQAIDAEFGVGTPEWRHQRCDVDGMYIHLLYSAAVLCLIWAHDVTYFDIVTTNTGRSQLRISWLGMALACASSPIGSSVCAPDPITPEYESSLWWRNVLAAVSTVHFMMTVWTAKRDRAEAAAAG